jgi:hypothetical protein
VELIMSKDPVIGFTYDLHTHDGCDLRCIYKVEKDQVIEVSPHSGWAPMSPNGDITRTSLTTLLKSGKTMEIDLEGNEHVALLEHGRFEKLLQSISRGNMPGEALKRQLTKALDLPKLPKLKRPKIR